MEAVLITVYLIIVVAMIAVILLQRSEGGGLGMGTAGSNGLISVRGSANLLTRTTAILAALFMSTAIGLTVISELDGGSQSILDRAADSVGEGADAPTSVLDALNALQPEDSGLAIPQADAPADEAPDEEAASEPEAASTGADPALAVPTIETPAAPTDAEPATGETPAAPTN